MTELTGTGPMSTGSTSTGSTSTEPAGTGRAGAVWVRRHRCPLGELTLAADASGVRAVLWPDDPPTRVRLGETCQDEQDEPTGADDRAAVALLDRLATQLDEYFAGTRRHFEVPLAPVGTPFQRAVWEVLRTIPYGSTMTYGAQAVALGDPNKARAVGAANGRNPLSIVVPCHRVTGAGGRLTGFAGGLGAKAWLLDHERDVLIAD